jgi:uncharacterized damage-inducible protein DinB
MTTPPDLRVAGLFPDWPQYAARLADGVRSLTDEQLAIRASAGHSPIWGLAAHTAGARTYWLCGVLGEPGASTTPFPDASSGIGWEDDETHPRTAAELVWALESTWAVVADCLARWTVPMLEEPYERTYRDTVQIHRRGSILNRLLTHEAYHAGEISQLLGAHGLPAIDLWARRPAATS